MPRKIVLILIQCLLITSLQAQLTSPESFLGYVPGEKFTPHWKIIDYFRLGAVHSNRVQLQEYGKTVEGRPLLIAIIGSPENIRNLEQIRTNNVRLAEGESDAGSAAAAGAPAIVWLSYNVHGNEASSSEAAMLTYYSLLDEKDGKIDAWLRNTVVIMDPCLNPDGRDRYVQWFNSVGALRPDPRLQAREHREPWPQGRTNHYYFDLNRDWAWQTQVESQQRLARYREWMPHVHVDYHEQGVNDPYYFAPAAEPIHEVITPWQREFQEITGKNHARYFDKNGWLYFTREIFDLFYPSYGDTWPMFNGAIGMTYEQGGGPAGGRAALMETGDTLTLRDRVLHHHTTALSTIEAASLQAGELVAQFRKYFHDAVSRGSGMYKSYVLRFGEKDRARREKLTELLIRNGIRYGFASGPAKGWSYATRKEESFVMRDDLVIPSQQPRSALVQVLFEPSSRLPDSLTYDITAWSLPYAYGVQAWASRDRISANGRAWPAYVPVTPPDAYAYVIRWDGMNAARAAAQLLQEGFRLRYTETPFTIDGQKFDRGSVIVLQRAEASRNPFHRLVEIAHQNRVTLHPVSTGMVDRGYDFGSDKVHLLKAPRVFMLTGEGVNAYASGEVWHFFEEELKYPITLVNTGDAGRLTWSEVDVLILPPGNHPFLNDKSQSDKFREWLRGGGRVIAMQQAVDALSRAELGLKVKGADSGMKSPEAEPYDALRKYGDRERDFIPGTTSGAIFRVDLDNSHPLAFGYPDHYYTLKLDDRIYEFMKDGWNVGVIRKEESIAGFVGAELRKKMKDGLLFGVVPHGGGTITYLADNPLFRGFWENGKLMMANAVLMVD